MSSAEASLANAGPLADLAELGISNSRPSYPRYGIVSTRLGSYSRYSTSSYPMSPEDLCAAGFFHQGPGDKVRCFWCDGALELWNEGDDPWREHAKYADL